MDEGPWARVIRERQEGRRERADLWVKRRDVAGRAQVRYLYVLTLVGAFYLALSSRLLATGIKPAEGLRLSVLDIEVSASVVWATAPIVLGFLMLATLGTFPAITVADKGIAGGRQLGEVYDSTPTALDFIFYTTPKSPRIVGALGHLAYPFAVSLFLAEAAWIEVNVWTATFPVPSRAILGVLGTTLVVGCLPRLGQLWWSKLHRAWDAVHPTAEDSQDATQPGSTSPTLGTRD